MRYAREWIHKKLYTHKKAKDTERMARDLVRLALSAGAKRQLLRRDEINKVLCDHRRSFSDVFRRAQEYLRSIFGMELVQTTLRKRYSSVNVISRQGKSRDLFKA